MGLYAWGRAGWTEGGGRGVACRRRQGRGGGGPSQRGLRRRDGDPNFHLRCESCAAGGAGTAVTPAGAVRFIFFYLFFYVPVLFFLSLKLLRLGRTSHQ